MGQTQNNSSTKKTEEQIKLDMKRKWDNFGSTQSSKINQEEEKKQEPNNSEISPSSNEEKNEKDEEKQEMIKEELKQEEIKEEENPEPKKLTFLTLKPREEQKNEEDNNNKEEQSNQNQIISNDTDINQEENNELKNEEDINNNDENTVNQLNNNENIKKEINNNNNEEDGNEKNKENMPQENKVEEEPKSKIIRKDIDLENVTIEKVFHITLSEENPKKYLFLDFYLAKILSLEESPSFKLDNLDDIILTVINEPSIKGNLLNYLLDCFHRAYEIIEIRFKDTLGPNFAQIHLAIATYFGQVVSSPESFDLNVNKKQISEIIKNYYLKTSEEEFLCLFKDITINCGDDLDSLSLVLHYLFEIMHMENIDKQTFFKGIAIKKNLNLLLKILQDYPKVREVFMKDALYNPVNINGRLIQALSFYGPYLSYSPWILL